MTDKIAVLERLARLLDEGKLTSGEYEILKEEIIRGVAEAATDERLRPPDEQLAAMKSEVLETSSELADQRAVLKAKLDSGELNYPEYKVALSSLRQTGDDLPVGDAHQIAIDSGSAINPDEIGWYPDPVQPETHARFYDGDYFVGLPRKRRKPGWYADSSVESLLGKGHKTWSGIRYFDGLSWTNNIRDAAAVSNRSVSAKVATSQPTGDGDDSPEGIPTLYKTALGFGVASVFLGGTFGLIAWGTVAVGAWAVYSLRSERGRWMAWVGLGLGIVFSFMNLYLNGHLDTLFSST